MHEGETQSQGHALAHERVEDGNGFIRTFHRNFVGQHLFYTWLLSKALSRL